MQDYLNDNDDGIWVLILKCICDCIMEMLESLITYITRNAFILTAITGQPFCEAAKMAFQLIVENVLRAFVVAQLSNIVLSMCTLTITIVSTVALFFMLNARDADMIVLPLVFGFFIAFFIANIFMTVLDVTIETLFMCFLLDSKLNDGSGNRPYYMPAELMQFMSMSENVLEQEEREKKEKKKASEE